MLLITASFDMDWPGEVQFLFNIAAPIKEITNAIVSFDCWMDNRPLEAVDRFDFYEDGEWRVIY